MSYNYANFSHEINEDLKESTYILLSFSDMAYDFIRSIGVNSNGFSIKKKM
jgi:hypothetical protein